MVSEDAFHRIRQAGIDEELFDVISGFEALTVKNGQIECYASGLGGSEASMGWCRVGAS